MSQPTVLLLRYFSKQPGGLHACRMALKPERSEKGILCHEGQEQNYQCGWHLKGKAKLNGGRGSYRNYCQSA